MAETLRAVEVDRAAAYWSSQGDRYQGWGDLAHGHPVYRAEWTDAPGELTLLLAAMGHRLTGYDIAAGMLDRARAAIAAASPVAETGEVERVESRSRPVAAGSVDWVVSRIVVIDALHFAGPRSTADHVRYLVGRVFWTALGRFDRRRGVAPAPACAGLAGERVGWLDEEGR